jgi:hypothetical protein
MTVDMDIVSIAPPLYSWRISLINCADISSTTLQLRCQLHSVYM